MNQDKLQALKETIRSLGATPLSYSKANLITQCPQRYYRKYIVKEKLIDPATGKYPRGETLAVVGSFLHKVLENCINHGYISGWSTVDLLLEWAKATEKEKLLHNEIEHANTFKDNTEVILNRVIHIIKTNGLKVYTEFWFNNFVEPQKQQNYGKWKNGKGNLSDPDKFFQGACDLFLVDDNGWGTRGLVIDYKSYLSTAHKSDIFSGMQLLLYCYFMFNGFRNLQSIKCATAEIPSGQIKEEGTYCRNTFGDHEEEIFAFLNLFVSSLKMYSESGFYPHTVNSFCSFCEYKLTCTRDAKTQCFNNTNNKLVCTGKAQKGCNKQCVNLVKKIKSNLLQSNSLTNVYKPPIMCI